MSSDETIKLKAQAVVAELIRQQDEQEKHEAEPQDVMDIIVRQLQKNERGVELRIRQLSAKTINDAYESLRIARTHYTMAVTLLMDRENIRDKRRAELVAGGLLEGCKNDRERDTRLALALEEENKAVHMSEESKTHNQMDYEIARDNVARLDLLVRAGLPVLALDDLPESTPPLDGKPDAP